MSAIAEKGVAIAEVERFEKSWNWGLILALGFCLLFWTAVILAVAAAV